MTTMEGASVGTPSVGTPIVGCGAGTGSSVMLAGLPFPPILGDPEGAAIVEATQDGRTVEV